MLSLGWRGSARHWHRYEVATLILAGLSTPLVLSVHTVVSFDFAVSLIPGWHATIFPPYFVAGAIYSGFAMVLSLAIPVRRFYGMESLITMRHIDNMAKVMLATGLIVGYGYAMEAFFAWYSASPHERFMMWNRMFGPYGWSYWTLISINVVMVQALWFKSVRTNTVLLFVMSIFVNIGMWLERFVIIVTSLNRDFVPSSWGMYYPTQWDFMTFFGTIGLFLTLFLLFLRFVPMISIFEVKTLLPQGKVKADHHATETTSHRVARRDGRVRIGPGAGRRRAPTMAQGFTKVEAYSPVPIEELNDIIHKRRTILPKLVLTGGLTGMATGFALQVLGVGDRVPDERRRPPDGQLDVLHRAVVRADDPVCVADRGDRHGAAERPAAAVSPGVQRRALLDGELRQVLPGDRIDGCEVRSASGQRVPAQHRREGSVRRCAVTSASSTAPAADGARSPAAARTCTMRRATRRSRRARRSPTTAPRARRRRARCRAAGCVTTKRSTPARSAGQVIDQFPFAIAHADLARGQERFNIYCTPCHGKLGDGNGMVVQRGLRQAASFHQDRLRQEKVGYFFDVITNGFGAMPDYAAQIPVRDRWLIVAYVRALQLSQHAAVDDVPADQRAANRCRRHRGTARAPGRRSQRRNTSVEATTTETYQPQGTPLPGHEAVRHDCRCVGRGAARSSASSCRPSIASTRPTWWRTRSGWAWSSAASRC